MMFSCKQNRNSNWCLFAILLILICGLKKTSQQNKGTFIFGGWDTCWTLALGIQEYFKQSLSLSLSLSLFCFVFLRKGIAFKCKWMSWLLDSLDLPSWRKHTHQLLSTVDGFNKWSVVSFVIKKLYVYLFMVKQCIYLVILIYCMQKYFHLLWSGNKYTDFVVFLNFLLTLRATWIIKKSKILRKLLLAAAIFCTLTLRSHVRKS